MNEVWKDIKDYEGLYQVSNVGNVKSMDRNIIRNGKLSKIKSKICKKYITKTGNYVEVELYKNSKKLRKKLHRLVAEAFISNPENKPQVNHINGIKTDNRVENLEWCTARENTVHAIKNKLNVVGRHCKENPHNKKVNQYSIKGEYIKTWDSMRDAEIRLGIYRSDISRCCRKLKDNAGGYKWEYV